MLRRKFLEIESKIDEILASVQPRRLSKAIPGIFTMGRSEDILPSEKHPAVIVVRIEGDDRQRASQVHDRIIDLLQCTFPEPRPPFRWIIHESGPYSDRPPPPRTLPIHRCEGVPTKFS